MVNPIRILAIVSDEHFGVRLERRLFAEVNRGRAAVGETDHHEAPSADVSSGRVGHGQRQPGGDRRVDRVATCSEDFRPGLARVRVRRHDHSRFGGDNSPRGVDCRRRVVRRAATGGSGEGGEKGQRQRRHTADHAYGPPALDAVVRFLSWAAQPRTIAATSGSASGRGRIGGTRMGEAAPVRESASAGAGSLRRKKRARSSTRL